MIGEKYVRFGQRLKELRERRGFSQRQLANATGISLSFLRNLEYGIRGNVRLDVAYRLAEALGITVDRLAQWHHESEGCQKGRDSARVPALA
jgi:transcriptional regulator with XRE-family HTH domain